MKECFDPDYFMNKAQGKAAKHNTYYISLAGTVTKATCSILRDEDRLEICNKKGNYVFT